jgi:hypothetical protein
MHLLMRRYSRSGYASAWFLRVLVVAFVALAVAAAVAGNWLVMGLAVCAAIGAFALIPLSARLRGGLAASERKLESERSARHG